MKRKVITFCAVVASWAVLATPIAAYAQAYGRGAYNGDAYQCSAATPCSSRQISGTSEPGSSGDAPVLSSPDTQAPAQQSPTPSAEADKTAPLASDVARVTTDYWPLIVSVLVFVGIAGLIILLIHKRRKHAKS